MVFKNTNVELKEIPRPERSPKKIGWQSNDNYLIIVLEGKDYEEDS